MVHDLVSMPEGALERKAFENRLLRLNNRLPALVNEIKDLVRKRDLFSDLVQTLKLHSNLDDFEKALAHRVAGVVEGFLKETAETFAGTPLYQNWEGFWVEGPQHLEGDGRSPDYQEWKAPATDGSRHGWFLQGVHKGAIRGSCDRPFIGRNPSALRLARSP